MHDIQNSVYILICYFILVGTKSKGLLITPNQLTAGTQYVARVEASLTNSRPSSAPPSFAEYPFMTNLPPYGGTCSASPATGR